MKVSKTASHIESTEGVTLWLVEKELPAKKSEENILRGVHAVVCACHVRRRPVGPAGEHHDRALGLSWLIHIHILEEHDDVNIWSVNPDKSDNLQEAGHPCEATKQPKATSLQIKNNKKNNLLTN